MSRTPCSWIAVAIGFTVLAACPPLSAQEQPSLAPGGRVRVTAPSAGLNRTVGTLSAVRGREIVFEVERYRPQRSRLESPRADTTVYSVSLDSLASLELSRGFHRHGTAGVIVGAVFLGAAGAGGLGKGWLYTCDGGFAPGCDFAQAIGTAGGLVAGALIGWGVGSLVRTEMWEPVDLHQLHVLVAPRGGRLGLGLSLSF